MIVFIDDEKWLIQAYIDELETKAEDDDKFTPLHFFYAKDALKFLNETEEKIHLLVIDIGMDYGDNDLTAKEPGGLQFLKVIQTKDKLKNIPIIILTVYDKQDVENNFSIKNNPLITFINRGDEERDEVFWKTVNKYV